MYGLPESPIMELILIYSIHFRTMNLNEIALNAVQIIWADSNQKISDK